MTADTAPLLRILAENVRSRREARALTLRELAAGSGLSQRFLVSLEAGRANVSVLKLAALAQALGTTAAALLGGGAATAPVLAGRPLALLGLRGAGKTAIGARVAERLELPFIELDQRIAERAGMTLEGLFSLHGADYYRRLEHEALQDLVAEPSASILATGGGIVTSHATFGLLKKSCGTVFLKASAHDHWERVVAQGDARPMANRSDAMAELRAMLRARRALYERADHTVDTSALGLERSVDQVVRIARGAAL